VLKSIRPRIVELGKIKIGRKEERVRKTSGGKEWRAPEKLDHFIITTTARNQRGDLVVDNALMEQLLRLQPGGGDKLREIPVELLSDDIDDVLVASHCYYGGKKLGGTCDEETCTWLVDSQGERLAEPVKRPCTGEHLKKPWKPHATLNCIINAGASSTVGGVYRFRTTSRITLEQLYGGLVHIQALTRGVLQGLPLRLVVRPMQVAPEGIVTTVYVVHVELRGVDLAAIQQQAAQLTQVRVANARQIEAARSEYRLMLRAPGESESAEEQEEVADEFSPEPPAEDAATSTEASAATPAPQPTPTSSSAAPVKPPTNPRRAARPAPPEDPARTAPAPAPASEVNPSAMHEASIQVGAEAAAREAEAEFFAQQQQEEQAAAPAPSAPMDEAMVLVSSAKTNKDLTAAFRIIVGLPKAEAKGVRAAYNAKLKELNNHA